MSHIEKNTIKQSGLMSHIEKNTIKQSGLMSHIQKNTGLMSHIEKNTIKVWFNVTHWEKNYKTVWLNVAFLFPNSPLDHGESSHVFDHWFCFFACHVLHWRSDGSSFYWANGSQLCRSVGLVFGGYF